MRKNFTPVQIVRQKALLSSPWIYFTAPVIAMQVAALVNWQSGRVVYCGKLHQHNSARCIFHCAFGELAATALGDSSFSRADSPELATVESTPRDTKSLF